MTDVVFVYRTMVPVLDTAIRFPRGAEAPGSSDLIAQTDDISLILLIDSTTALQEGH